MHRIISYEEIEKKEIHGTYILIDVRSPLEYDAETIPGAINIPIFEDEERKLIGTVYKENVERSKEIGMEVAARRLPLIYKMISHLDKQYDNLIFFCARGGFRSSSLVALFGTVGIDAIKLDGGYKSYRKHINENLPSLVENTKFFVLYGNTGTGKTDILKAMRHLGAPVLDLEGLANHRGSLFGSVGMGEQRSQKMFESLLYYEIKNQNSSIIFIEGESKKIGKISLPTYLFNSIKNGVNIKIEAGIETRIANILKDYVHENDEELISVLNLLRNNIGNKIINQDIQLIENHNYKQVIKDLMLNYYDPLYENKDRLYDVTFINTDSKATAKTIIEWSNDNLKNHM